MARKTFRAKPVSNILFATSAIMISGCIELAEVPLQDDLLDQIGSGGQQIINNDSDGGDSSGDNQSGSDHDNGAGHGDGSSPPNDTQTGDEDPVGAEPGEGQPAPGEPAPTPQEPAPTPEGPVFSNACIDTSIGEQICTDQATLVDGVAIDATMVDCIAPCGVNFVARADGLFTVEDSFRDLNYIWSFGDAGSIFRSLPDDFPFGNSANRSQGPVASHVFATAGTYTVQLTVTSADGQYGIEEVEIRVQDPDIYYQGSSTLCYSRVGDFSDCPSAAQHYTDLGLAAAAIERTDNRRLLLRAGETTIIDKSMFLWGDNTQINRFGNGDDPILQTNGLSTTGDRINNFFYVTGDATNTVFANLQFIGDYDPSTGFGEAASTWGISSGRAQFGTTGENALIYRVTSRGLAGTSSISIPGIVAADTVASDWYLIAFYSASPRSISYIGNVLKQDEDVACVQGPTPTSAPRYARGSAIRNVNGVEFMAAQNDLFANSGGTSHCLAHQPNIRYNTNGVAGHYGNIVANRLVGGYFTIKTGPQNGTTTGNEGRVLVQRNYLELTEVSIGCIINEFGGTVIRNNLCVKLNEASTRQRIRAFIWLALYQSSAENMNRPIDVYNNTWVNEQTGSDVRGDLDLYYLKNSWPGLNLRENNNLFHMPAFPNASDYGDFAPLDANAMYRPLPGSSAIGGSVGGPTVIDTLEGTLRPVNGDVPSIGALEPSIN